MTLIAPLFFAAALFASVSAVILTVRDAMPRIKQVVDAEFGPAIQIERRVIFGEVKGRKSAEVIAFPLLACSDDLRLAA